MSSTLRSWAAGERYNLAEELRYFDAGAKLFSPSGKDITMMKAQQLLERVRELDEALRDGTDA